jgi:ABC-type lipoprotein release transport system permease subunit
LQLLPRCGPLLPASYSYSYEDSAWDLWSGLAGAGVVIATASLATLIPAAKAARVDPGVSLRFQAHLLLLTEISLR